MSAPFLRAGEGGVSIAVKVQPRASRNQVQGLHGAELKIAVTAPPVDSAANEALAEFIAEQLGCGRSAVRIARGRSSRHKVFWVAGVTLAEAERKLGASVE